MRLVHSLIFLFGVSFKPQRVAWQPNIRYAPRWPPVDVQQKTAKIGKKCY
ncbi:hypothetical protein CRENPOLYSF1_950006 [Crenothrix polyspora]|uniref:Uncharacterized protein n=1 Tax=Crenothrix polyspora TaxID=360316 RepID=A0A1R4HK45_9GAMM|nr:hypothetical protein CRENPOLYSF1_950006 [Crenothrix polyspora]